MKQLVLILFLCCTCSAAFAQTIAEKKAGLGYVGSDLSEEMQQALVQVNEELEGYQKELHELYIQAVDLYRQNADDRTFQELLVKINAEKAKMNTLEEHWREMVTHNQSDGYALWHQPNTTLEQLVIDYGSQDYVYVVTPEIANIPISVNSNLPIPRASWGDMLEMILAQNGVGIRQLNPFLRQLYLIKEDRSSLKLITNKRQDLHAMACNDRIAFLLAPEPADVRRSWSFLEKFVNPNSTVLQMIERDILIVGQVSEVQELLKLYDFVSANRGDKDYRIVPLTRVNADEMAKILSAIFGIFSEGPVHTATTARGANMKGPPMARPCMPSSLNNSMDGDNSGLKVIPLSQLARAVFLVGTREEIRKAENIICEVEEQVGESRGRVIYWYTAKHSDPEELAVVLQKVYALMSNGGPISEEGDDAGPLPQQGDNTDSEAPLIRRPYDEGFFLDDQFVINRNRPRQQEGANENRDNFIVDLKTGSIAMVVEGDILPKLKELIKKLDVPKKMVQIEVLLFEKRLSHGVDIGLNLLRIGAEALNQNIGGAVFNNIFPVGCKSSIFGNKGVFEFLFSRKKHDGIPAYDLAYRFLLTQDDVTINASPSVLAVNQTQAVIEIEDEVSINTGIFEVASIGGVALKDSFVRARYGIKIDILPTIHLHDDTDEECEDDLDYVTLNTDITFETFQPAIDNRPDVTTRHVLNEVNIPDGQTVIIGGLRRKNSEDCNEAIPFLGDLPGLGKLFSLSKMHDRSTEMFIFITPKIITDPVDELNSLRATEMTRRPGDIPPFLCALEEAREWEANCSAYRSMMMLFGRPAERCYYPIGEYDGR